MIQLVVLFTQRLQSGDTAKNQLYNAIRFEFAVTNHLGTEEQGEEQQGLPGDFKAENGKHDCNYTKKYLVKSPFALI